MGFDVPASSVTPHPKAAARGREKGARGRLPDRLCLVLAWIAVAWFQLWTVRSTGEIRGFGGEQRDYYNLLIDGWLEGQLHMKVDVPAAMLALPDPYDPAQRPPGLGLHDASFYQGKYFVYFGVAPAVTLMLPFRLATGVDLPLAVAVLIFVHVGFLLSAALWLAVRRTYFAESSALIGMSGVMVLGVCALGPLLLRRPDIWELPIAGGYAFAMATLGCVWRSVQTDVSRARLRWLAGAGLALGLAIASRPTYLFTLPLFVAPLWLCWLRTHRPPWREALSAGMPLMVVGLAMAWHNHARFDHPLQFGQAYQLSLDYESRQPHFQLRYLPFNVQRHFFSGAEWDRYFPFIRPEATDESPPGYTRHRGDVYGVLATMPFGWLVLGLPLALWRREGSERQRLFTWLVAAGLLCAGAATVMHLFFSALARYQLEFVPAFMLLAAVGAVAIERALRAKASGAFAWVGRGAMAALAIWSVGFGALYSLQFDGLLKEQSPSTFAAVARRLNTVPAAWERWAGVRFGPMELTLQAPDAPASVPLRLFRAETERGEVDLVLEPLGGTAVRLVLRMGSMPARRSEPFDLEPGRGHRLHVSLGCLFPPATHPYFGDWSAVEARTARRTTRVLVNGREVLSTRLRFGSARAIEVPTGESQVVQAWQRKDAVPSDFRGAADVAAADATLRLRVVFPSHAQGRREPLVVTGQPGAGDLLFVEYLDASTVRFGFDHWGAPTLWSSPVTLAATQEQVLEIRQHSLLTVPDAEAVEPVTRGPLHLRLNGSEVFARDTEFHVAEDGEVAVGWNPIGGTSCEERFSGTLRDVSRESPRE
jgi:hypothetical protein